MNNFVKNKPISFDFHGDSPLDFPFENFQKSDISFYLDLDTYIGKDTCGQACEHCWFVSNDKVKSKAFEILEGRKITDNLNDLGYKVYPRYTDTFAYKGGFMKLFGPAHNREFRQEIDKKETETMIFGDAWTSGKPLMGNNYKELLDIAYDAGYRTISMTYHGLIDNDLNVITTKKYPIKGVFHGRDYEQVVQRISQYNNQTGRNFRVNVGLTIGTHNNTRENLLKYSLYFNKLNVDTVRFNSFTDHGGKHKFLELDDRQTEQLYQDLNWIHKNIILNFQMGVSEDIGTYGIEVMDFPKEVGWCQAGHQFFTIIPSEEITLSSTNNTKREIIGDIVGCVNLFEPHFGNLIRVTDSDNVYYEVSINNEEVNNFNIKRIEGVYKNGCYARELKKELISK